MTELKAFDQARKLLSARPKPARRAILFFLAKKGYPAIMPTPAHISESGCRQTACIYYSSSKFAEQAGVIPVISLKATLTEIAPA